MKLVDTVSLIKLYATLSICITRLAISEDIVQDSDH